MIKDVSGQNNACLPYVKSVEAVREDWQLVEPETLPLLLVDHDEPLLGVEHGFVVVAH